ncbi:hypothetical protein AVEN_47093-1 [Araneus ventricosus]|uniref:Uncharacterized protein n=1 Tax=Araneus ventricosus TaxID=182803 RepID=A0A4Y2ID75_ARAVE|nr:hypothetical protein AVEN_47093-1 [Araneus ventricosus]
MFHRSEVSAVFYLKVSLRNTGLFRHPEMQMSAVSSEIAGVPQATQKRTVFQKTFIKRDIHRYSTPLFLEHDRSKPFDKAIKLKCDSQLWVPSLSHKNGNHKRGECVWMGVSVGKSGRGGSVLKVGGGGGTVA